MSVEKKEIWPIENKLGTKDIATDGKNVQSKQKNPLLTEISTLWIVDF